MSDYCKCCGAHEHPRKRAKDEIRGFLNFLKRTPDADPQDPELLTQYLRDCVEFYECVWCEKSDEECTCFL
jgi:hypothetical protein